LSSGIPSSAPATSVTAYVALGSNLGDRAAHVAAAVTALGALPGTRLIAVSATYETAPVGPAGQQNYFNAVAALATSLAPLTLLDHLLAIEQARGRVRRERWGPRTLDLDLLLHGGTVLDDPRLTLPHPRLLERAFVLAPLADVAPDLVLAGRSVSVHLAALDLVGIVRLPAYA
jgi:2-amino-4-hydroxy-6-hydroxymethyldihydropteridine diphosphokinase